MLSQTEYDFLRNFQNAPVRMTGVENDRLQYLLNQKYIRLSGGCVQESFEPETGRYESHPTDWVFSITDLGKDALSEFEQMRESQTQAKREQRKNRQFQILLVLLSVSLTLFAEHLPAVIRFLARQHFF